MQLDQDFSDQLSSYWKPYLKGKGSLDSTGSTLRLVTENASSQHYSDSQIDDYQGLPRRRFPWNPPLTLSVRARFSHPSGTLKGTAGFGFWNDPFLMTGARLPTLPRAIWFFYASPPSDMQLAHQVPGCGWKAATIDAAGLSALAWAPLAPASLLLMNHRPLYNTLWPAIQNALRIREQLVGESMTDWHSYVIEWGKKRSRFHVDGEIVAENSVSPRGPLGLVIWLDNQYMVITPRGRFAWGALDVPDRQWMELDYLRVEPGCSDSSTT